MAEPSTQAQDHDRRIGRQLDRRLEGVERAIGELGRRIIGSQPASPIAIGSLLLSIPPRPAPEGR